MCIAERHPVVHQIVGGIRRVGKASVRRSTHALPVELHRGEHAVKQRDTAFDRVHRVKGKLLVLLHVLIVRKRNSLHRREKRHQRAVDASGLSSD